MSLVQDKHKGFTLIEVMVTMVILIIAGAFIVPSLNSFFENLRLKTSARGLFADLNYTKITAMKTLRPYTLLLGGINGNEQKWIVFKDINDDGAHDSGESVIKESTLEGGVTLTAGDLGKSITFDRNGLLNRGTGTYILNAPNNGQQINLKVSLAGFIRIE